MKKLFILFAAVIALGFGCQRPEAAAVAVSQPAKKIAQLVGDIDKETGQPTANQTESRYKLIGTDLGASFEHKGKTYFLFGDTFGGDGPQDGRDTIAYSTDTKPTDGLDLTFLTDDKGQWRVLDIPGVDQTGFAVPTAGVSINNAMYVYHTTDASSAFMGRSVLAKSTDDGQTFSKLYDLSTQHFINVSVNKVNSKDWPGLPDTSGEGIIMFGSGQYRKSNVRLAYQPTSGIEDTTTLRYFRGLDDKENPTWTADEQSAEPLFFQSCVGEFSVTYNPFIKKWIMLYNCLAPWRGINLRTADQPWGPWAEPQILYHPERDGGYCYYIHQSWEVKKCDNVQDKNRDNAWGGEYGPYQIANLATGDKNETTIYFTMSTWNPYTVVLMEAKLKKE